MRSCFCSSFLVRSALNSQKFKECYNSFRHVVYDFQSLKLCFELRIVAPLARINLKEVYWQEQCCGKIEYSAEWQQRLDFCLRASKTIRHGDSFWWIAVSTRPNLYCIHHSSFHFKSDRQIKECKALNFLIQMSYRWLIYYSCNLSKNKRSLFGAKVGNDTANHAWMNPPAIAKQRSSPRPCSSLDA